MAKKTEKPLPKPTDTELKILRVIWQLGAGSVREVLKALNENRKEPEEIGYTTVLKMLQIMTEKGLVYRDESQRPQIYRARRNEAETQQQFIGDLIDRLFDGSARKLVMQALSNKEASNEELAQIEALLDKIEGEQQ